MTIAPFMRRWGILILASVFLLFGLVVLCAHLTFAFEWATHPPMSDMVFYPGLPSDHGSSAGRSGATSPDQYSSLGSQISIALGVTLLAGWIGFVLGGRSVPARK